MSRLRKAIATFLLATICIPVFLIHRIALRLDDWLYPSLRDVIVRKPLFILGLPRSGTTLLHRLIATDRQLFTTMPLWELLLAPAVCEKSLLRQMRSIDRRLGSPLWRIYLTVENRLVGAFQNVHSTTLHSPEEDYLALLPFGGCFIDVIRSPMSERVWKLAYFCEQLDRSRQAKLISTYKRILQRHLYFRGQHQHLLAKNPSLTSWLPALIDEFPDACVIGLRRDPAQSVPSQLSSLRDGMRWFGNDVADPAIVDRFVHLLASYWQMMDRAKAVQPPERFRLIEYQQLIGDSHALISQTMDQFGYCLSEEGVSELQKHCSAQRLYRSSHQYNLEEFGLDQHQLDLAFHLDREATELDAPNAWSRGLTATHCSQ
ncbi:sulfotransferase family protein [Rhodopirellula bahusiensis]